MQRDAEAGADLARGLLGGVDALPARKPDLGAGLGRQHAGDAADRPGAAEHHDALAGQRRCRA